MNVPTAGPSSSQLRKLSGSIPGLLDPTQLQRLLRLPGTTLSFAAFDPRAASVQPDIPDLRKLSLNEELYRPKRVVVETAPTGESFWRFVPKARRDEGVVDEGLWPRVIEICGELVECSQDQWDIYKLDPEYECYVRAPPDTTIISRVVSKPKPADDHPTQEPPPGKRRMSTPSLGKDMPPLAPRKKMHTKSFVSSSSEGEDGGEESEVESMIVDDEGPRVRAKSSGPSKRAKKFREEVDKNRKARKEKFTRRAERLGSHEDEIKFDFTGDAPGHSRSVPPENFVKRKVSSLFDSLRSQNDPDYTRPLDEDRNALNYAHNKHHKRTRTVSPSSAKRDLEAKRLERERLKKERREHELNARRQARYQKFMEEVYAEVPDLDGRKNGASTHQTAQDTFAGTKKDGVNDENLGKDEDSETDEGVGEDEDIEYDSEAARQAAIAESRRKLAELEADRPLWEEQAKRRAMREKAEQQAQHAKAEERRKAESLKAEAERRAKAQQQEQEARRRESALRQEQEQMARREREKRQRQQRWSFGPWTAQRALERYKVLSDAFDATKFSPNDPLTFDVVPWPVLQSPVSFSVEDVDWAAVEKFFEAAKPHMRPQDYKTFVEKSHRRFHPDRWRSRGLLKSVADDAERGCLEVAANTVAQALTPLWRDLTAR